MRVSSHYHPVATRSGRDPNPYTLRDIIKADPDGEGGEFPTTGDYLWIPDRWGAVLLTDVPDASGVEMWVKWEGLTCQGPIGDGVAWGSSPHNWIAVEGTLQADDEFKILKTTDWPRLPQRGDVVCVTVHPQYQFLHVVDSGEEPQGTWRVLGTLQTYMGDVIDPAAVAEIPLNRRPWDD